MDPSSLFAYTWVRPCSQRVTSTTIGVQCYVTMSTHIPIDSTRMLECFVMWNMFASYFVNFSLATYALAAHLIEPSTWETF